MSNLIGISGKIGSGKDEVGQMIQYLIWTNGAINMEQYEDFKKGGFRKKTWSGWENKKFAGKLKEIVALLIGCNINDLEDRDFKNSALGKEWDHYVITSSYGAPDEISFVDTGMVHTYKRRMTPRLMLQLLGTEAGRQIIHPNIWVNALFTDYDYYCNWVITDMRFENEAKAVKSRGGSCVRVNRITHPTGNKIKEHASETGLDDYNFDYVIENDGSLEDLMFKVVDVLKKEEIL